MSRSTPYFTPMDVSPRIPTRPLSVSETVVETRSTNGNDNLWMTIVIIIVVVAVIALALWLLNGRRGNGAPSNLTVSVTDAGGPTPTYTASWTAPTSTGSARLPLSYNYQVIDSRSMTVQTGTTSALSFVIDTSRLTPGATYTVSVTACGSDGRNCSSAATTQFTFTAVTTAPDITSITMSPLTTDILSVSATYTTDRPMTSIATSATVDGGTATYPGDCTINAGGTSATCAYNLQTIYSISNPSLVFASTLRADPMTLSRISDAVSQHWVYDATNRLIWYNDPSGGSVVVGLGPNNTLVAVQQGNTAQANFRYDPTDNSFQLVSATGQPTGRFIAAPVSGDAGPLTLVVSDPTIDPNRLKFGIASVSATPRSITFTGRASAGAAQGPARSQTFNFPQPSGPVTGLTVTRT